VSVAAAIEFQPADFDMGHDVTITVRSDTGEVLGTVSGNLRSTMTPGADPTEPNAVTLAIDLRPLVVPQPGTYQVSLAVNGEELASAGFVARPAGPAPE
jgi:hypothetical protein